MLATYDYAVIRVVPRVEREEFANVGVILSCPAHKLLVAAIEAHEPKLLALDPTIDLALVHRHLRAIPAICAGEGPIGALPQRARFHWLTAKRSSIIQCSSVHAGRCDAPAATLDRLMDLMVRPPR